jgi:hypothetical protein
MELLKRGDSVEIKKTPENKVDVKALSAVVKKAIVVPASKKVVAVAKAVATKKPVKVVAKSAKKGKK